MTTPAASEMELANPAPATPMGCPVPQPAIRTGAKMAFKITVNTCTTMVGWTIPVPRNAEPMTTIANCSARLGRNQCRYWIPAATVAALRQTGAHFRSDIITGVGGKQILVDDPSGNPIELFEPTLPEASLSRTS